MSRWPQLTPNHCCSRSNHATSFTIAYGRWSSIYRPGPPVRACWGAQCLRTMHSAVLSQEAQGGQCISPAPLNSGNHVHTHGSCTHTCTCTAVGARRRYNHPSSASPCKSLVADLGTLEGRGDVDQGAHPSTLPIVCVDDVCAVHAPTVAEDLRIDWAGVCRNPLGGVLCLPRRMLT